MLEADRALSRDDPETAAIVLARLRAEGVDLREGAKIAEVRAGRTTAPSIDLEGGETIAGSHLLVAAGRTPNVGALELDAAEVAHDKRGVIVDRGLRSV